MQGYIFEIELKNTFIILYFQAVVVGYDPGKGRFQGKVGALRCKMANGKLFSVGSGYTLIFTLIFNLNEIYIKCQ